MLLARLQLERIYQIEDEENNLDRSTEKHDVKRFHKGSFKYIRRNTLKKIKWRVHVHQLHLQTGFLRADL